MGSIGLELEVLGPGLLGAGGKEIEGCDSWVLGEEDIKSLELLDLERGGVWKTDSWI